MDRRSRLLATCAAALLGGCALVAGLDGYEVSPCEGDCDGGADSASPPSDAAIPPPPPIDAAKEDAPPPIPDPCAACGPSAAQQVCVDGGCAAARRVFVTSTGQTGDLGGTAGADAKCAALATAAGLGGTWRAWLSSDTGARNVLEHATEPYRLLDGTLVATDWDDLIDGTIAAPINLDERRSRVDAVEVWTGTKSDGSGADNRCGNFGRGDDEATGRVGHTDAVTSAWTSVYDQFCDRTDPRLYCFEQ